MLTFIKEYITSLITLSIFILFIEILINKSKFKKYIMLFVSILMIMQFLKPIKNLFKEEKIENEIVAVNNEVTRSLDIGKKEIDINKEIRKQNDKMLKDTISYMKEDIRKVCLKNQIVCKDVIIFTENNDKVKSLVIKIKNAEENILNVKEILKYIEETYNIEEKIIKIEEELS